MEIDLAQAGDEDLNALAASLRSQVCIVGGGIAGLTLARWLAMNGVEVTVLEAGGRESSEAGGGDPFGAELRGWPHRGTREGRVRALGGCSLVWGGQLLPLPEDVEWPVALKEVEPYQYGVPLREQSAALRLRAQPAILAQLPGLEPRLSRFVPFARRNLARTLGGKLSASAQVRLVLHASVMELVLAPERDRIVCVEVATPGGKTLCVEAEQFVVAAGTVETCRLLLASRSVAREGVGNAHGQVGLNFHDHLTLAAAEFTGPARTRMLGELRPWVLSVKNQPAAVFSMKLEPSRRMREELGLHRSMAHLTVEEPEGSGLQAVRELLRARQRGEAGVLRNAAAKLPGAAAQGLRLLWEARVRHRRYVSAQARVFLQLNVAQDAPSASRVSLSEERDRSGLPKAVVDWRISAGELATFRRLASYLREQLTAAGVKDGMRWLPALFREGEEADWELLGSLDDARHAMGGACMGTDPRTSVVDPELRVHGIANLSLASAAVFPDGSAQLPTLTLNALCLRLAERLKRQLA